MSDAMSSSKGGRILKRANPSTIQDKFMVGYQGWFTCAGDGEPVGPGHHGWLHWFDKPLPDGGRPNTDLWPDVSTYSPSELFPTPGLKLKSGEQALLFSSRHPKTVQRHFNWMAQHGVDGAFLQRFAGQCDLEQGNEGIMRIRDEVGDRVMEAAEKEGRVFAIMYDVSGVAPDRIQRVIERDWIHLLRHKGILDSPNYLREKGRPVIALWGFGFDNAGHTPALVRAITSYIRNVTPGGAYIMGGCPAHWRTAMSDADRNPEFLDVWLNDFDALSPWTVGRYPSEEHADSFYENQMKPDFELLKKRNEEGQKKVDYIPVVLPGGSGFNLSEGKWGFNDIKRNGGRFLWKQIFNARRLGVRTMYGAMWDEYDEGTAFMPVVTSKRLLPEHAKHPFMALDEDGYDLPSDWYMRICGFAAEGLRSERRIHDTFPSKELDDYWASRPKYEDVNAKSGDFLSGSSSGVGSIGDGQSYQDWLATQKDNKDEPPPPPYSLEAAEELVSGNQPQQPPVASGSGQSHVNASPPATSEQVTPAPTLASTAPALNPASKPTLPPQPVFGNRPTHTQTSVPPAINTSSRPQVSQPTTINDQSSSTARPSSVGPNTMTSLANDFDKHTISGQPAGSSNAASQPAVHTVHAPAPSPSFPQFPAQFSSFPQTTAPPESTGSWSQGQWPPPEWKVNKHSSPAQVPHAPYSSYPGQPDAGANYRRHNSFHTASPHPPSPASLGPRPSMSASSSNSASSQMSFPQGNVGGSQYSGSSSYMPPMSPSFPAAGALNASSYSQGGSSYLGHVGSGSTSPHASPPISPPPGSGYPGHNSSTYPGQGGSSYPGSSYPGQSYSPNPYGSSSASSYGPASGPSFPSHEGLQFPQAAGGEGGYFNASQPSSTDPSYSSSPYPSASPSPNPGWYPGAPSPNLPPRPPTRTSYPKPSTGPSFPSASTSSAGAFGYARNAVDKVAGKKTREQLESQVGSLAQTGSKLFSKFTK